MQTYSTQHLLSPKEKITYWNDVVSEVFTPLETKSIKANEFEGRVSATPIGHLWIGNVLSLPATVTRTMQHVKRVTRHSFFLHLQLRGELFVAQNGKEIILEEGDFTLLDNSLPYSLMFETQRSTLLLIIPADDLRKHMPVPEEAVAIKFSGKRGLSHTTSTMMQSVWRQVESDHELAPALATRVSDSVLDVLGAAWAQARGPETGASTIAEARRVQILHYIEANLRDPDLSVQSISAAFRISARYLHMLFASEPKTLSNYILQRRVEECAKQLVDPLWRSQTITTVAFNWGFNNATHFARVFRDHCGMSPRDYRNGGSIRCRPERAGA